MCNCAVWLKQCFAGSELKPVFFLGRFCSSFGSLSPLKVEYAFVATNDAMVSEWLPMSLAAKPRLFINTNCKPNPKRPAALVRMDTQGPRPRRAGAGVNAQGCRLHQVCHRCPLCVSAQLLPGRTVGLPAELLPNPWVELYPARPRLLRQDRLRRPGEEGRHVQMRRPVDVWVMMKKCLFEWNRIVAGGQFYGTIATQSNRDSMAVNCDGRASPALPTHQTLTSRRATINTVR